MDRGKEKIFDLVYQHPQLEEYFRTYDSLVGDCVLCQHLFASLEELAGLSGVSLKVIIDDIGQLI